MPRIVAIETSSRHGSVAVAVGPALLTSRELPPTQRHAIELMPAIRDLTIAQGWAPDQIDHLYLSLGPGSFTGLRIAVAVARSLAQAIGCKLVGVPSLDVIAHNAPADFSIILPILDAKRAQIFSARFLRTPTGDLHRDTEPALLDPASFVHEALTLAQGKKIALLGEGLDYHRSALAAAGPAHQLIELDRTLWPPRAATVHHLGYQLAQNNHFSDPASLLPLYIRLPEAEELYRKKHGHP